MADQLREAEQATIWSELSRVWGIESAYWYPLQDTFRDDVLAFEASRFHAKSGGSVLRRLLREHGVTHCWSFSEDASKAALRIPVEEFDPEYTGLEHYWSAAPSDWIVYVSHEDSVTIGGRWLIEAYKRELPSWRADLWDCGDPTFVHKSA